MTVDSSSYHVSSLSEYLHVWRFLWFMHGQFPDDEIYCDNELIRLIGMYIFYNSELPYPEFLSLSSPYGA